MQGVQMVANPVVALAVAAPVEAKFNSPTFSGGESTGGFGNEMLRLQTRLDEIGAV